jgi:hypothetical protein
MDRCFIDACECEGPFRADWPMVEPDSAGETAWRKLGNCVGVDSELFFPTRGEDTSEAKRVCATCVVSDKCLAFAVESGEKFGIWGGKSEKERRALRRAIERPGPVCGTRRGADAHRRRGEVVCAECREGQNARQRALRGSTSTRGPRVKVEA